MNNKSKGVESEKEKIDVLSNPKQVRQSSSENSMLEKKLKEIKKIYGTECRNCSHRIGVHFVSLNDGSESCDGYVRKDQPNFDGKLCNCKRYSK